MALSGTILGELIWVTTGFFDRPFPPLQAPHIWPGHALCQAIGEGVVDSLVSGGIFTTADTGLQNISLPAIGLGATVSGLNVARLQASLTATTGFTGADIQQLLLGIASGFVIHFQTLVVLSSLHIAVALGAGDIVGGIIVDPTDIEDELESAFRSKFELFDPILQPTPDSAKDLFKGIGISIALELLNAIGSVVILGVGNPLVPLAGVGTGTIT